MKSKVTVRRLLAMVLCFALVLSLGLTAFADEALEPVKEPCGDVPQMTEIPELVQSVSKSQTATELDENYTSKVTLSLPAADYPSSIDLVLVIDVSGGKEKNALMEVKAAAAALCDEMAAKKNIETKIGIVAFNQEAHVLTEDLVSVEEAKAVLEELEEKLEGADGANMVAGLAAAKEMLDAGNGAEKQLVLLSRGAPTGWLDAEGEPVCKQYGTYKEVDEAGKPVVSEMRPAGLEPEISAKDASGVVPMEELLEIADWNDDANNWYFNEIENTNYENGYKYSNLQKSVYMTAQYLSENILGRYPLHLVAFGIDEEDEKQGENDAVFQYWKNLCGWICEQSGVSYTAAAKPEKESEKELAAAFRAIADAATLVVDAGTRVDIVIGKADDYDFQFINDPAALSLTVNGEALAITKEGSSTYGFGEADDNADGKTFPFVLHYYADDKGETLVWDINVPITKDVPVQLTYSVKLTDPKTEAGTYGTYDADGSKDCDGLFVCNSAVLKLDKEEAFPKPTVSYTVKPAPSEKPTETPEPTAKPTATPTPTAEPTATPAPTVTPAPTAEPTAAPTATPAATAVPTGPKTGDDGVSVVWFALAGISALGLGLVGGTLFFRKRGAHK